MPALSIIVPVYKREKYLHKCVDSILEQSFTDFELILVNDGSPDACPKICDEYARQEARIIVIHQRNAGVSAARNAGLRIARGEWISFVDSDDWIEKNTFEEMINAGIKNDVRIVQVGMRLVNEQGESMQITDFNEGLYDETNFFDFLKGKKDIGECNFKIFARSLIFDDVATGGGHLKASFPEGISYNEDSVFHNNLIGMAKRFYCMGGKAFYNYLQHPKSASYNDITKEILEQKIKVIRLLERDAKKNNFLKVLERTIMCRKIDTKSTILFYIAKNNIKSCQLWRDTFPELNLRLIFTPRKRSIVYLCAFLNFTPLIRLFGRRWEKKRLQKLGLDNPAKPN